MIAGENGLLYLEIEDILVLYAALFECTEQEAADQLRNREGLEGALSRPLMYAHYQEADLALQAAVLAHGIAEGQPFIEGNKRAAALACIAFLEENDNKLTASQAELATWIHALSKGGTAEELGEHIRLALVPTTY
jgi:death-on-curing protein